MDEHRIGLKPIRRQVWAPTGKPFTYPVQPGYEWLYVYAFANPESGESLFWLIPVVNKQAYGAVMAEFARMVGAGADHRVLVVQDGAGFHIPPADGHPDGIQTVTLPPYSPELQPAERLWELTDVPIANRAFDSIEEVETALSERCVWLEAQPDLVTRYTLFHWWPLLTN